MENLVEKYNIDKTFYKRYFFDGAGISFGVDFQKFLLFKKGKFLNPKQKDFYINKYIEQEIIDFYENQKFYLPKIDFDITTRCTLKCKCCSNCTPVFAKAAEAKKVQHLVMTDKEFQHSLDALLLAVDRINVLQLMGGEPLTNKHLSEIIEYCASKEQIDVIKIVTNGTVIPQGDLISIVITLFYTIINYVVHVTDMGMLTPIGINIGTILPIPLINRWIYQFYDEGSGAAAEFYNTMRPYFVPTYVCISILLVIAVASIFAIIKIYKTREI